MRWPKRMRMLKSPPASNPMNKSVISAENVFARAVELSPGAARDELLAA